MQKASEVISALKPVPSTTERISIRKASHSLGWWPKK
jgi:hypothetical protein